jgi:hypothetical protein
MLEKANKYILWKLLFMGKKLKRVKNFQKDIFSTNYSEKTKNNSQFHRLFIYQWKSWCLPESWTFEEVFWRENCFSRNLAKKIQTQNELQNRWIQVFGYTIQVRIHLGHSWVFSFSGSSTSFLNVCELWPKESNLFYAISLNKFVGTVIWSFLFYPVQM